jgi:hypothetical protein
MRIREYFKGVFKQRSELFAKNRLIVDIEPLGALLRVSLISPLDACDERIDPCASTNCGAL